MNQKRNTSEAINRRQYSTTDAVDLYQSRAVEWGLFRVEEKSIRRHITQPSASILDVGAGTGRTTNQLDRMGHDVIGVDVSKRLIQEATRLFPEISFAVADAADLGFGDNQFDALLFSYNGIDYLHPEARRLDVFSEARRVLKEDGVLIFSSHNSWYLIPSLLFDRDYLRDFYLRNGNISRLGERYKLVSESVGDLTTYLTNPVRQKRQLEKCGLSLVDVVGKSDGLTRYLELMPHFVARPD